MLNEFSIGLRTADTEMDTMVPLSMSAEGVGAALYFLAFLAGSLAGGITGLLLVALGAAALFSHLGHPQRSWRVITAANHAWISRGAMFTAGLIVLGGASLLLHGDGAFVLLLRAAALVCTFVVILYTGLLFSSINAVPFWTTPLLPVLFVLHSLTSAALLLTALLSLSGHGLAALPRECGAVLALLGCTLALTWMLPAAASRAEASQESASLLTDGKLRPLFHQGALIAGLAVPLALVLLAYVERTSGWMSGLLLMTAVVLRLAGDVSFRFALLRAGVYTPLI